VVDQDAEEKTTKPA